MRIITVACVLALATSCKKPPKLSGNTSNNAGNAETSADDSETKQATAAKLNFTCDAAEAPVAATLWQLSPVEYEHTLNDLLGLERSWAETLPGGAAVASTRADSGAFDSDTYLVLANNAIDASNLFTERFNVLAGEFGAWPQHGSDISQQAMLSQRNFKPNVDGNLDSFWQGSAALSLGNSLLGQTASQDLSATFRYHIARSGISFFVEVTDDVLTSIPGNEPFNQDAVELFIDTGGNTSGAYRASSNQLSIAANKTTNMTRAIPGLEFEFKRQGTSSFY